MARSVRSIVGFARARAQESWRALLFTVLMIRHFAGPVLRKLLRRPPAGTTTGVRIRRVIEGMGISFVKLGQFLAMRFDIIPPEICRELDRLFSDARVLSAGVIRRRIEQELGRPIHELFASFDSRPLGSASIAQVHRAVTLDGQEVVVKVQRPGIQVVFAADMRILRRVAWLCDLFRLLGRIELRALVESFSEFTEQEMNFFAEGRTADRVRRSPGNETRIPQIRWDLTTSRILTMEFLRGVSLLAVCQRGEIEGPGVVAAMLPGVDLAISITRLARTCLHQMFVTGLFHGDPHPGNILIMTDGTPVLLDFGIFGQLTPHTRQHLALFYEALAIGNIEESFRCYQNISSASADTEVALYRREVVEALQRWYDVTVSGHGTLQESHPLKFVTEIIGIMRKHAVRMPPEQLLFWRSLTTLASVALRLPFKFDLIATMKQFFMEQRPGAGRRIAEVLTRPETITAWTTLANDVLGHARGLLARTAGGSLELQARRTRSPRTRRQRRTQTRSLALALVGISAAMLISVLLAGAPP